MLTEFYNAFFLIHDIYFKSTLKANNNAIPAKISQYTKDFIPAMFSPLKVDKLQYISPLSLQRYHPVFQHLLFL